MERILYINSCVRPESRTHRLALHAMKHLPGTVEELRLYEEHIPPLDMAGMEARENAARTGNLTDPALRYAAQFAGADTVVVAAPYWDLLFPTAVRAYFEAVTVTGVTFRYTLQGIPEGLCKAGRLIYVTTAGGPIGEYNFGFDYVKALARLYYGIPEVICLTAEGLDIVGSDPEAILKDACRRAEKLLQGDRKEE